MEAIVEMQIPVLSTSLKKNADSNSIQLGGPETAFLASLQVMPRLLYIYWSSAIFKMHV